MMRAGMALWLAAMMACLGLAGCASQGDSGGPDVEPTPAREPDGSIPPDEGLAVSGRWLPVFDGEVPAINMVQLHDGRILYWSGVEADQEDGPTDVLPVNSVPVAATSRVLDLSGPEPVITTPGFADGVGFDLFCSGQTVLPDGKVLAAGGTEYIPIPEGGGGVSGITAVRVFDPATDAWRLIDEMLLPRWYATTLTGPSGDAVVIGGIQNWHNPAEHWASWEEYSAVDGNWTIMPGTDVVLPLYSRTYLVPGGPLRGQYFTQTTGAMWAPFGEHPSQPLWSFQYAYDAEAGSFRQLGTSVLGGRNYAANVMLTLEPDRGYAPEFIMYGGTWYQTLLGLPFTERADLSVDPPTNQMVGALNTPRWHPYGVLLPDGTVLGLGGAHYDNTALYGQPTMPAILDVERFDPATNAWSEVAPMSVERAYHSTAVLLPDGRVLVGGHVPDPQILQPARETVNPQIAETRFQIYEPPYLFRGERPVIVDAPSEIDYGAAFDVDVAMPGVLDSFVMVRAGATTHGFDADTRQIRLDTVAEGDGTVRLQAPPDAIVAPPGHYMLFALAANADGAIPSVATWVHID